MDSRETRGQGGFTTTDWSAVARAAEPKAEGHRVSLEQLLTRYLPALRSHLVRRMRLPPDRADDVLQGFVTNKILEAGLLTAARKERGRFRTLLLTALCNYMRSTVTAERAKKRSPGENALLDIDRVLHTLTADEPAADIFDLEWARGVLTECLARLEKRCRATGREDLWGVFQGRVLAPALGGNPIPYEDMVARYGFTCPGQAANALVNAKRMFNRVLREVIGEYATEPHEIEEELLDFRRILASRPESVVGSGTEGQEGCRS